MLTILGTFGIEARRRHHQRTAELADRRRAAYTSLLAVSGRLAHTADTFRLLMQTGSGPFEGVAVFLGLRKPLDVLELDARIQTDNVPLYAAWTEIWAVGSQDAIRCANLVVSAAGDLISATTVKGTARGKVGTWALGLKWTPDQLEASRLATKALAEARRALGEQTRRDLGIDVAELWA